MGGVSSFMVLLLSFTKIYVALPPPPPCWICLSLVIPIPPPTIIINQTTTRTTAAFISNQSTQLLLISFFFIIWFHTRSWVGDVRVCVIVLPIAPQGAEVHLLFHPTSHFRFLLFSFQSNLFLLFTIKTYISILSKNHMNIIMNIENKIVSAQILRKMRSWILIVAIFIPSFIGSHSHFNSLSTFFLSYIVSHLIFRNAAILNYPGGEGLVYFNSHLPSLTSSDFFSSNKNSISIHLDEATCMSGVSLFLEMDTNIIYDKTVFSSIFWCSKRSVFILWFHW